MWTTNPFDIKLLLSLTARSYTISCPAYETFLTLSTPKSFGKAAGLGAELGAYAIPYAAVPLLVGETVEGVETFYSPQTEAEVERQFKLHKQQPLGKDERYYTKEEFRKAFIQGICSYSRH